MKKIFILIFILYLEKDFLMLFLKEEINIDNIVKYEKEDNLDFSDYSSTIKPIAIYNINTKYGGDNLNYNKSQLNIYEKINNQMEEEIKLAKSHGIYGFAFYYFYSNYNQIDNIPLDLIINKNLKINFLLLIENYRKNVEAYINLTKIFIDIKKYIIDERYIKFYNKYVIGLNDDAFNKSDINFFREKFKDDKLGKIFILSRSNIHNNSIEDKNFCDGLLYSPSYESLERIFFKYNKSYEYFYSHLLYHNLLDFPLNNNICFRMSLALSKYPLFCFKTKTYIYGDYSPKKFYFLNKIIIDWTKRNYNAENQYIFIEDFNNLKNDNLLGYANINSFSKALYGLPFILDNINNFNIENLEKDVFILVQVHVYYTDLIIEIINKTNNIPIPFDLYITTNIKEKKNYIENYLKRYSKANKYEILITPNKGRDIIPCLIQLKDIIMKYKYLCHIHTKKHENDEILGNYWRIYLYENLLGSENIIKQIISDFENNNRLGFIFPEHFYALNKFIYEYKYRNWNIINKIFEMVFTNLNIRAGNIINFPSGNMFWARTSAIYQIFNEKIIKNTPEEKGQTDGIF